VSSLESERAELEATVLDLDDAAAAAAAEDEEKWRSTRRSTSPRHRVGADADDTSPSPSSGGPGRTPPRVPEWEKDRAELVKKMAAQAETIARLKAAARPVAVATNLDDALVMDDDRERAEGVGSVADDTRIVEACDDEEEDDSTPLRAALAAVDATTGSRVGGDCVDRGGDRGDGSPTGTFATPDGASALVASVVFSSGGNGLNTSGCERERERVNETTTDVDGSNSSLPDADAWLRTAERAGRVAVGLSRFASPSPKNTATGGGGGGGSSSKASKSKSRSTTPATPLERRAFLRSASKGLRVTIDEDDDEM
jgi:hypothetical protein